jgi:hypothetical protein
MRKAHQRTLHRVFIHDLGFLMHVMTPLNEKILPYPARSCIPNRAHRMRLSISKILPASRYRCLKISFLAALYNRLL